MESAAPYLTPGRHSGPRNLAAPLAAWLRTQGFVAVEQQLPAFATAAAHWVSPRGERFELDYTWQQQSAGLAEASCRLRVLYAGEWHHDTLFTGQRIWRLRDARQLLLGNVRYANARALGLPATI